MYPLKYGFGYQTQKKPRTSYPYENIDFNQPQQPELYGGIPEPQPPQEPDITDAYRELLTRAPGPAMSAYSKFLSEGYPQETKPTKLGRLGAILSGAAAGYAGGPEAGIRTAREQLDRPYQQAVRRYGMEGQRLAAGANLEESQYQHKIAAVKAIEDAKDKQADNKRADLLANDLMKTRAITRKSAEDAIESRGMFHETDKETGILYIVKRDGSKTPVGKFDQSTGEKVEADRSKIQYTADVGLNRSKELAKTTSALTEGRNRRQFSFEQPQREASQIRVGDATLGRQLQLEQAKEDNRKELIRLRADIAAARDAKKITGNKESVMGRLRENYKRVQALVDANPDRYKDIWITADDGTHKLADNVFKDDADKASARQELYNAYYEGFKPTDVKAKVTLPPVTKVGPFTVKRK